MAGKRKRNASRTGYNSWELGKFGEDVQTEVQALFEKKFIFKKMDEWRLPEQARFHCDPWRDIALDEMKVTGKLWLLACLAK